MMPKLVISMAFILILSVFLPELGAKETYYVGFLAPFPSPSPRSPIPASLSLQWKSAFNVALEVLNGERKEYSINFIAEDSACDWGAVHAASSLLQPKNLIGIIGPACSGAAVSAVNYLDRIPVVSFAATNPTLSGRSLFPNFFRTVYSDFDQALAILATIERLKMSNATILSSKDYYSLRLAGLIQEIAKEHVSNMVVLESGENSTIDTAQLQKILDSLQPHSIVILAVLPLVAEDIWKASANMVVLESGENSTIDTAQLQKILDSLQPHSIVILAVLPLVAEDIWKASANMGEITSSFWYFGTDGATAFDPYLEDNTSHVFRIEGAIGIRPYGGDYSESSACRKFIKHWQKMRYPGFEGLTLNRPQPYMPYVIDTVTLFFEIVDALRGAGIEVNAWTVLSALKGNGSRTPVFKGCTGNVEIDPLTGSRKVSSSQPAVYDVVSLVQGFWELKGRTQNATYINLQPSTPPIIEIASTYNEAIKGYKVSTIGLVLSTTFVLLIAIIIYMIQRSNRTQFTRIAT